MCGKVKLSSAEIEKALLTVETTLELIKKISEEFATFSKKSQERIVKAYPILIERVTKASVP